MKLTNLLLIVVVAALFGCSTQKRTSQSPSGQQTSTAQPSQEKKILYPTNHDASNDRYEESKPSRKGAAVAEKTLPANAYPRHEISFRPIDSEHVRIKGVNPLPEGGVLEVDLERLSDEFCYPYKGEFLSDYGDRGRAFHTGVDIRTPAGDTIRAAFPGVVRMSKLYSSYGNIVVIRHYAGFETVYAHFSKNLVKPGDKVEAGDAIGLGGRTGRATCDHLHFEVRAAGEHIDPKKVLDINNQTLRGGILRFESSNGVVTARRVGEPESEAKPAEQTAPVVNAAVQNKPQSATTTSSSGSSAGKQYHTVKSGDTLYGIALKYKTTVAKLCQLNGIKEKSILSINQKIRVK